MTEPHPREMLGSTGIWSSELRYGDRARAAELAAHLEDVGFTALWVPDVGGNLFGALDRLLAATRRTVIATGILNIWLHTAEETAAWRNGLTDAARDRVLLGLGVSHAPLVDAQPGMTYARPVATMVDYLDRLDRAGVPAGARCLAALGPRMTDLARERSLGAHPYLVTPEHTAAARGRLGPDALLAVEQGVVLERDADTARSIARDALAMYAALPNYARNWKRLGFTDDDVDTLSDRLVDALVVRGDVDDVAERVDRHRRAGADHVCIQLLTAPDDPPAAGVWRRLADATCASITP